MIMPPEQWEPKTRKQRILFYGLIIGVSIAIMVIVGSAVMSTASIMVDMPAGNYTVADKKLEQETVFFFLKQDVPLALFVEHPEWGYVWVWQADYDKLKVGDIYSYVPTYW